MTGTIVHVIEHGYVNRAGTHEVWAESRIDLANALLGSELKNSAITEEHKDALFAFAAGKTSYLPTTIKTLHDIYRRVDRETVRRVSAT